MLVVENLCKSYPEFKLKNISFTLEEGYIMGFIGANGAGKSTTLKSILNIVKTDSGKITIFGKEINANEVEIKQDIAFMMGAVGYYSRISIEKLAKVYSSFYKAWNEETFNKYLFRFNLNKKKKVRELSAGMKVKFAMAMALSHNSKLIIFDEPTSGLDPVARAELLDLFQEIVEDGKHSILFSTHITSDLDKCADYIIFIKDGELISNSTKDDLIASHALVTGGVGQLTDILKNSLIGYRKNHYGFSGLIKRDKLSDFSNLIYEKPNLEDIMVYYNKESIFVAAGNKTEGAN